MPRCNNPDHPHCTVWVLPGDDSCAHGHPQLAAQTCTPQPAPLPATDETVHVADTPATTARPHLHVSGFDPRAAGGRQLLKLELRAMPPACAAQLTLLASSRLRLEQGERQLFARGADGDWLPLFLEFSSRGLEHGQYRIDLELHSRPDDGAPMRAWTATLSILVPRADASLLEIHETFLASRKQLRIHADDAAIARVHGRLDAAGPLDIDVSARNAGIARLDLDAGGGKVDLGFSSIAWDEELFEVELPVDLPAAGAPVLHPCPVEAACIVAGFGATAPSYLRLFALEECVLGRLDSDPAADVLLAHHDGEGPARAGLTRRISARHALVRPGRVGFEIEDVSRYGLLVDGAWPGRQAPLALRAGMRIECTASIPGVLVLEVAAVLAHALILRRVDAGAAHEMFYLVAPERAPDADAQLSSLPLLFHRDGGFWQRDASGADLPLQADAQLPGGEHFTAQPYPDLTQDFPPAASTNAAAPALAC